MKKLILLALAVIMTFSLSVPAFANTVTGTGDYTVEVTGSYVAGNESNGIVYCIDITWEDLDVTYHAEKGAVWNTDTLKYSETTSAYWEGKGTITVTNRSNTRISATPTYTAGEDYTDADMTFSTEKLKVSSAEFGEEQSGSLTFTPTGSLPSMNESATIGTITLTIAQDPDATYQEARALIQKISGVGGLRSLLEEKFYKEYGRNEESWPEEYRRLVSADASLTTEADSVAYGKLDQKDLTRCYNEALSAYYECVRLLNQANAEDASE